MALLAVMADIPWSGVVCKAGQKQGRAWAGRAAPALGRGGRGRVPATQGFKKGYHGDAVSLAGGPLPCHHRPRVSQPGSLVICGPGVC